MRYAEVMECGQIRTIYDFEVTPYGVTWDIGKGHKVLFPWHRVQALVLPRGEHVKAVEEKSSNAIEGNNRWYFGVGDDTRASNDD